MTTNKRVQMKVPVTAIKTDALYFKEEGLLSVNSIE